MRRRGRWAAAGSPSIIVATGLDALGFWEKSRSSRNLGVVSSPRATVLKVKASSSILLGLNRQRRVERLAGAYQRVEDRQQLPRRGDQGYLLLLPCGPQPPIE